MLLTELILVVTPIMCFLNVGLPVQSEINFHGFCPFNVILTQWIR
jgi:hypothetical protein